jgi:hypothetical protein
LGIPDAEYERLAVSGAGQRGCAVQLAVPVLLGAHHRRRRTGVIGRRVYRASGIAIVPGWICIVVFFLVGVVTATGSPGDPGKGGTIGVVLGVAVGVLAALFSLWMGAVLATNSLIVTSAGLIHRHNLRRRLIGWPEIESFTVGPGRGRMRWPTLIVRLSDGSQVITDVASYTTGYPGRIARELTAVQASSAAAAVTSQDTTAGEID